jgi:hypothetical protein
MADSSRLTAETVRGPLSQAHTEEQKALIAGVGDRMKGLGQHGRAAGGGRGDALQRREADIARECRDHHHLRLGCPWTASLQ